MLRCQLSEAREWQVLGSSDTTGRCPKIENYQCEYPLSFLNMNVLIFFVTAGCDSGAMTPKLCPWSRVRHLALRTFHLPRVRAPVQDTPCVMRHTVLQLLSHFVYSIQELWTDTCSQKRLECHKTDMGHFYLVLGRKFLFSLALAFHFSSLVKTHKSPVLSKHHAKYYSATLILMCSLVCFRYVSPLSSPLCGWSQWLTLECLLHPGSWGWGRGHLSPLTCWWYRYWE